jgi:hypothetical protein
LWRVRYPQWLEPILVACWNLRKNHQRGFVELQLLYRGLRRFTLRSQFAYSCYLLNRIESFRCNSCIQPAGKKLFRSLLGMQRTSRLQSFCLHHRNDLPKQLNHH